MNAEAAGCRRLRCIVTAVNVTMPLRADGCGEEDPRVTAAKAARSEDDPQNSRVDIVLPSGRTRDEVAVRHGWQLSLELNSKREVVGGSEQDL